MKKTLLALLLIPFLGFAQSGKLTDKNISELRASFKKDNYMNAVTNAVSNNNITDLALNRKTLGKTDHFFKHKVNVKGITNQYKSGRCWMFTSMNVLRPKVIEKFNLKEFEFSYNYLYFWDILEKSNLFLENVITSSDKPFGDRKVDWLFSAPVGDGGVWNSFTNLVKKYGIAPKDAMPETNSSNNTGSMRSIIKRLLRQGGVELRKLHSEKKSSKEIAKAKFEIIKSIYKVLAINLGEPPVKFNWTYTTKKDSIVTENNLTPKSFLKKVVDVNFDDYVLMMDDPTREYYKLYEIEYDRNVLEGRNWKYINLPASQIKKYAVESIKANEAMYFSCDVGKQLNRKEGLLSLDNYDYESLFNIKYTMNKKERILSKDSGSSHGMCLVGVDTDDKGKVTKWLLENSWGSTSGHNGYLTMTDKWFDQYMFRVVVLKKFIDKKTLKILKSKSTLLPPWDPMFEYDK